MFSREDGKSSMKFYTDPLYFEELWAIEMGKQFEENRKKANQKKSEAKKGVSCRKVIGLKRLIVLDLWLIPCLIFLVNIHLLD